MFTQCPECSVAFRVTAEVLRQAAGKVRCGGCGSAFNALEYLSEEKPAAQPSTDPQPDVPELTPDSPGDLEAGSPPIVISAEQSAALLKTLDQLAGEDIRIEDTGIEWRVLDDTGEDSGADSGEFDAGGIEVEETIDTGSGESATGSMRFLVQDEDHGSVDLDADQDVEPATEEMRFDDNTPLPDDFDFENELIEAPEPPLVTSESEPSPDELQVDLALGDPDDWHDLLGEFDELAADLEAAEAPDEKTPAADEPEVEAAAGTAASGIELPDMDTQFAQVAESMGIDLSETYSGPGDAEAASGEAGGTSIDDDLIAAAFETEALQHREDGDGAEPAGDLQRDDDPFATEFSDEQQAADDVAAEPDAEPDTGDAIAVEFEPTPETVDDPAQPDAEPEQDDAIAAEPDAEPEERDAIAAEFDDEARDSAAAEIEAPAEDAGLPNDFPVEIDDDEAVGDELADDLEFHEIPLDVETELAERETVLRDQLEQSGDSEPATDADTDDPGLAGHADTDPDEQEIPELTEEEKTINMLIDQDLLAMAVEDEEGFASTIIQRQPVDSVEDLVEEEAAEAAKPEKEHNPLVETIIMEGEFVHGALDEERRAADREAMALAAAARPETDADQAGSRMSIGLIAAAIGLVVLLALQYVHFSREALATVPAINNAIGPVYRALGMPVSPAWDVTGWRFEATKGSTDEAGDRLTIYSRIGNTAAVELPLPLIHVSLTDRFEEVVGSRIMEPAEFVVDDADPRQAVAPGGTFNAVIVIESPSPEVTGFKLNVCYRLASGQLKCEIEDFK